MQHIPGDLFQDIIDSSIVFVVAYIPDKHETTYVVIANIEDNQLTWVKYLDMWAKHVDA